MSVKFPSNSCYHLKLKHLWNVFVCKKVDLRKSFDWSTQGSGTIKYEKPTFCKSSPSTVVSKLFTEVSAFYVSIKSNLNTPMFSSQNIHHNQKNKKYNFWWSILRKKISYVPQGTKKLIEVRNWHITCIYQSSQFYAYDHTRTR